VSIPLTRLGSFGQVLRRRRVLRVVIIYAAAGWVAVEVSDTVSPPPLLPDWTSTFVLVLPLLGLQPPMETLRLALIGVVSVVGAHRRHLLRHAELP
jgi:hypothetical protein